MCARRRRRWWITPTNWTARRRPTTGRFTTWTTARRRASAGAGLGGHGQPERAERQPGSEYGRTAANDVVHRADSLDSVVKGLDNYKQVANVSVTFGFDKAVLTNDDKAQLDSFAGQLGSAKSYILEVTGGTDSIGSGAVQLRPEPAPRGCGGAVPGGEVRHCAAPVLSDRHRQGSRSGRTRPRKGASRTGAWRCSCCRI